jgi:hypothetical protein
VETEVRLAAGLIAACESVQNGPEIFERADQQVARAAVTAKKSVAANANRSCDKYTENNTLKQ